MQSCRAAEQEEAETHRKRTRGKRGLEMMGGEGTAWNKEGPK